MSFLWNKNSSTLIDRHKSLVGDVAKDIKEVEIQLMEIVSSSEYDISITIADLNILAPFVSVISSVIECNKNVLQSYVKWD